MAMRETIINLFRQLEFEPVIENAALLEKKKSFVVVGMGGSHLGADLIKSVLAEIDLTIHSDYGLPALSETKLKESLIILSSHSGNTEEVLDAFELAQKKGYQIAAVSTGGKLAELARAKGIPIVKLPIDGVQPRLAVGYSVKAMLKLMGQDDALNELKALSQNDAEAFQASGEALAEKLKDKIVVVYSSPRNLGLAVIWKVSLNETAKKPAFLNVFPELNHNEIIGFSTNDKAGQENFGFIFLKDSEDSSHIVKRMDVTQRIFSERSLSTEVLNLGGNSHWHKIFNSVVLADWTCYHLAQIRGFDPEDIEIIEEFKRLIKG